MFQKVAHSDDSTLVKILNIGKAYTEFFKTYPNYFQMFQFFQLPHFHKQVSEEMRDDCSLGHRRLWDIVIGLIQHAIEEKLIRPELNPADLGIILWSSATSLMLRMDNESDIWMERIHVDLAKTLALSNSLLFSAMLSEKGRAEIASNINS
jgi:hypothetical protein